jgi:tryptophan synthase alpha chain
MTELEQRLATLRDKGQKALITFVTAGDPPIEHLPEVLRTLEAGGADVIEVGIPFSDPIADGPTIQASSQRALERGIRLADIFRSLGEVRVETPIVLMGYTNTALRVGYGAFAQRAADAGASGVILSDMTPDDAGEWKAAAEANGLDTIFLAAPTSTDMRLKLACDASSGFVYCVSRTGVTGAGSAAPPEVMDTVARMRRFTKLPICVGFGISTSEHVRMVCGFADGAVVGSYIVDLLAKSWNGGKGAGELLAAVAELKRGCEA